MSQFRVSGRETVPRRMKREKARDFSSLLQIASLKALHFHYHISTTCPDFSRDYQIITLVFPLSPNKMLTVIIFYLTSITNSSISINHLSNSISNEANSIKHLQSSISK
jgi:hypothetical protein